MKKILLACTGLMAVLTAAAVLAATDNQSKLEAQAKITKAEAEKIALAKVPGGTIKESEIEKEHGKLIWSFDVAKPGSEELTEVEIDAITGAVLGADDQKEEHEDSAKSGKDDDSDDKDNGAKEK